MDGRSRRRPGHCPLGSGSGVTGDRLDLDLDDDQRALADSVRRFCYDHCSDTVVRAPGVPDELWRSLAEMGVLLLATPEGGGGALEIVAAMEQLGEAACPGPLVPTFFAAQLLDGDARMAIGKGESIVAIGTPPLLPWAPVAQEFIALDGPTAWRCRLAGPVVPVDTLGLEPWGRVELERVERTGDVEQACAIAHVAVAAYLVGAGSRLLSTAAGYAADRIQFGKSIGEFQAIAHPLATSLMNITAARHLTRIAAHRVDRQTEGAAASAAVARLSATDAALETAYRAHQTLGALGFTIEGPVAHLSRRVRQLSLQPPGPDNARAEVLLATATATTGGM